MEEPKKNKDQQHPPHGGRDRDSAADRPQKRRHYAAGADGEQDVDASATDAKETFRPDRDGTGW